MGTSGVARERKIEGVAKPGVDGELAYERIPRAWYPSAEAMTAREDAAIAGHVEARWRDQGAEAAEEGAREHVREGGASARGP